MTTLPDHNALGIASDWGIVYHKGYDNWIYNRYLLLKHLCFTNHVLTPALNKRLFPLH